MSASNLQELEARVKELRHLVDSCGACDGNGHWEYYADRGKCGNCAEFREELSPLEDQLAIERNAELERNRPAWTSTPPSEPGLYHVRHWINNDWIYGDACRIDFLGMLHFTGAEEMSAMHIEIAGSIVQFWPTPIPEPPSQITPPISDKGDPAQ